MKAILLVIVAAAMKLTGPSYSLLRPNHCNRGTPCTICGCKGNERCIPDGGIVECYLDAGTAK